MEVSQRKFGSYQGVEVIEVFQREFGSYRGFDVMEVFQREVAKYGYLGVMKCSKGGFGEFWRSWSYGCVPKGV